MLCPNTQAGINGYASGWGPRPFLPKRAEIWIWGWKKCICFGASWEEMGANQRYFPFFSYTFFFIFPHPQIQISGDLGKNWGWAPSFRIHFFLSPSPNFETPWENMVLDPNRIGFISICDSVCV